MSSLNDVRRIVGSVEKSELMEAIGREIKRVDQSIASSGYTNWAIWGALGLLLWRLLDLMKSGLDSQVALGYVFLLISGTVIRSVLLLFASNVGSTTYYTRIAFNGGAALARFVFTNIILVLSLFVLLKYLNVKHKWIPISFLIMHLAFSIIAALLAKFARDIPIPRDLKPKGFALAFIVIFFLYGSISSYILYISVNFVGGLIQTDNLRSSILLFAMTVLCLRLLVNMGVGERRVSFQRLETELTLDKISIDDAKDRYENLMLGMNVSAATRPFINAVTIPVDEANSAILEIRQLLAKRAELKLSASLVDGSVSLAILDRANDLADFVKNRIRRAQFELGKLGGVCASLFGTRNIYASPIAQEYEVLRVSLEKLNNNLVEVAQLITKDQ